jgi:hypothetical protein
VRRLPGSLAAVVVVSLALALRGAARAQPCEAEVSEATQKPEHENQQIVGMEGTASLPALRETGA